MFRRFVLVVGLLVAGTHAPVSVSEAQTLLHFSIKNCDTDKSSIDVRVYDGADTVLLATISETKGLAYGEPASLYCMAGNQPWTKGCQVRVSKGSYVYSDRVEGDTCFRGTYDHQFLPIFGCNC